MEMDKLPADDFKKLFAQSTQPSLPAHLEERIMAGVERHKLKKHSAIPSWFSMNLAFFSLSLFFLSSLALLQYITQWHFPILLDTQKIIALATGLFFILWIADLLETTFTDTKRRAITQ